MHFPFLFSKGFLIKEIENIFRSYRACRNTRGTREKLEITRQIQQFLVSRAFPRVPIIIEAQKNFLFLKYCIGN